jgi:hypothetical protein
LGPVQEQTEAEEAVAPYTGVRRSADCILVNERLDNLLVKDLAGIDQAKRDVELIAGAACSVYGLAGGDGTGALVPPKPERDSDQVKTALGQEGGSDGAVDAAAERDHCLLTHSRPVNRPLAAAR